MTDDKKADPADAKQSARPTRMNRVARPARDALATVAAAAEPLVERVGHAVEGVERSISERPGMRARVVRRRAATPLASLNDVHPEVRRARPVPVGLRTIPVDEIAGTAVGGGDQRGGDFLPLKPFRGRNWAGRWQRLNRAQDALAILPPIDVVKHAGRYWVVDGHNRVALALYQGQPEIDASIVELVPPGERRTEPVLDMAPTMAGSRTLRTRGAGRPASDALAHEDRLADPGDPE
ncbi:MAG TPA: hypothetical protein VK867_02275 [Candidatus Limnocylindrales bacterium]|nr:hypothetical protein [Candidatus Limnocylindrales bacterium]